MRTASSRFVTSTAASRLTVANLEQWRQARDAAQAQTQAEPAEPQAPRAELPPTAAELPIRQQMVILLARRGDLSKRVVEELRLRRTPEPVSSDWAAMIKAGYLTRKAWKGDSILIVTPIAGMRAADDLCRWYVKQFGIHHITHGDGTRSAGPWVRCTCGWSVVASIVNGNSLVMHAGNHMKQVREGTLPEAWQMKCVAGD